MALCHTEDDGVQEVLGLWEHVGIVEMVHVVLEVSQDLGEVVVGGQVTLVLVVSEEVGHVGVVVQVALVLVVLGGEYYVGYLLIQDMMHNVYNREMGCGVEAQKVDWKSVADILEHYHRDDDMKDSEDHPDVAEDYSMVF